MVPILESLSCLEHAVQQGHPIICHQGKWKTQGWFSSWIETLVRGRDQRTVALIHGLEECLDKGESRRIRYYSTKNVCFPFTKLADTAEAVIKMYRHHPSPLVRHGLNKLKWKKIALEYRLGSENGGIDTQFETEYQQEVESLYERWQKQHPFARPAKDIERKLRELTRYPKFLKLLQKDSALLELFSKWSFKQGNVTSPFIEFPGTVEKLIASKLSNRIGFHGGQDLEIQRTDKKDLVLCFEGRKISILKEKRIIVFQNEYTETVKNIFQIFRNRDFRMGNLEYFPSEGICNWNCHQLGPYDPTSRTYQTIDLTGPQWYKQLRPTEFLSFEQAHLRYDDQNGEPLEFTLSDWIFTIIAKNGQPSYDLGDTHAYLQIAIPRKDRGYQIYDFGIETKQMPNSSLGFAKILVDTVPGVLSYPDENTYMTDRDQEGISFALRPQQAKIIMEAIRKDIIKITNNQFFFQLFGRNCLYWVFKKLHNRIENLPDINNYRVRLYEVCSSGLKGKILKTLLFLPKCLRGWVFETIVFLVQTKKDGKVKSFFPVERPWDDRYGFLHPGVIITNKRHKDQN